MRQMGFKGSGGRFHITQGNYEAHVDAQCGIRRVKLS
jgi:hypothetical protein